MEALLIVYSGIVKKVIKIENGLVSVEDFSGKRQELKTIIEVELGDYVLSQQNVIIEILEKEQAEEMINIFQDNRREKP